MYNLIPVWLSVDELCSEFVRGCGKLYPFFGILLSTNGGAIKRIGEPFDIAPHFQKGEYQKRIWILPAFGRQY